jgi:hypothetical protein
MPFFAPIETVWKFYAENASKVTRMLISALIKGIPKSVDWLKLKLFWSIKQKKRFNTSSRGANPNLSRISILAKCYARK